MSFRLIFVSVLFCHFSGISQTFTARVKDKSSKEAIAFAHIGVPETTIGTVSDENGYFSIDLKHRGKDDSIYISNIGYTTIKLSFVELNNYDIIELAKNDTSIDSVTIKEKKVPRQFIRSTKIGRKKARNNYSGSSSIGWGGELGIIIRAKRKINRIKDVNFKVMPISCDSLLFRINVYELKNKLPSNSILQDQIFVTAYKGNEWIKKNVEDENIFFSKNIIVTIESVKAWNSSENVQGVFYNNGILYRSPTYSKPTSVSDWQIVNHPKLTLYLTLDQYSK